MYRGNRETNEKVDKIEASGYGIETMALKLESNSRVRCSHIRTRSETGRNETSSMSNEIEGLLCT